MNRSEAPWSPEEVASLNAYQKAGVGHPFTAHHRQPNGEEVVLIATPAGWIEHEGGPVVQAWAHKFMTDGSWRKYLREFVEEDTDPGA